MAEIASAFVSVLPSARGFGKSLDSQVSRDLDSSGKTAGKRFGSALKVGALAALGGVAIAGAFLKDAVAGAGDLEQSVGAIDTVFGKSAKQMHKWSKGAAQDVGLTRNEFNELGTLIGSQLKNGGTAMDDLAPKTKNLVTMGADLSSMFGGTTKEAVEALSSALKGERDPIERYGVSLNQAKIDSEAAALGFKKVDGALTDQAKQAATLSLITKQTADAQGNFAKESDTLAGKQQRLSAQFGNFKTSIGTALLPVMTKVFGFLNDTALPAVTDLFSGLGKGSPIIKTVGNFVKDTLLPPIQDLAGWVMDSLVPAIQDFARDALPGVKSALDSVKKGLNSAKPFFEFLGDVVTNILLPVLGKLAKTTLPLVGTAVEKIGEGFGLLGRLGTALWNKALQPAFKFIVGAIANILDMWSAMLETLAKVPGFGWAKKAADAMAGAADKAREVADGIKKIPTSKTVTITTVYMTRNRAKERSMGNDYLPRMAGLPGRSDADAMMADYGDMTMQSFSRGIAKGAKKSRKALEAELDKLKSSLSTLKSDFASLAETVSSSLVGDLFGVTATAADAEAGTAGSTVGQNFIAGLMSKKAELTGLLSSFKTLVGWGVPGSFLSQLFASGNGALITELAGMGQAGAVSTANLFGEVTSLGAQLGSAVATNDYGPDIREQTAAIKELRKDIAKLPKAVEEGAKKGTKDGNDERTRDTRQRERAGR